MHTAKYFPCGVPGQWLLRAKGQNSSILMLPLLEATQDGWGKTAKQSNVACLSPFKMKALCVLRFTGWRHQG